MVVRKIPKQKTRVGSAFKHFKEHKAYRFQKEFAGLERGLTATEKELQSLYRANLKRFKGDVAQAVREEAYQRKLDERQAILDSPESQEMERKRGYSEYAAKLAELKGKVREVETLANQHWGRSFEKRGNINDFDDMRKSYLRIRQTLRRFPLPKNAKVASIGCGAGSQELLLAKEYHGITVSAVDPGKGPVKSAKILRDTEFRSIRQNVSFGQGSFENPNLPKKSFDFVMSIDAFHATPNWELALKNMKELINPNSKHKMLLITYIEPGRRGNLASMPAEETRKELEKQGFEVIEVSRPFWRAMAPGEEADRARRTNARLPNRYQQSRTLILARLK